MENSGFEQRFYYRIKQMMNQILALLKTHEDFIYTSSFVFLFLISTFYIFVTALVDVPEDVRSGFDATIYLGVAEAWLNGQLYININYGFGISLLEIPAILFGSIFSLDSTRSLIMFFSIVACVNIFLLAVLSRYLTKNKWTYHLAMLCGSADYGVVSISIIPRTDGFHATLILLILLIQIKLLDHLNGEEREQNSTIKMPLLALSLGVCSGSLVTIRHVALAFLPLLFLLWGVYIFRCRTSMRRKITLFSLIIVPAILIATSYLFIRCVILGDIKYFFYFGANSNIWLDSFQEQWYYCANGLPNPTLKEYLQTHSVNYMFQRELLGVLHIFSRVLLPHFAIFLFLLVLGIFVLFRKNYRLLIILFLPIFYLTVVYGWFWDYGVYTTRYLLPIYYIFYLMIIYTIHYLLVENIDTQTSVRSKDLYIIYLLSL